MDVARSARPWKRSATRSRSSRRSDVLTSSKGWARHFSACPHTAPPHHLSLARLSSVITGDVRAARDPKRHEGSSCRGNWPSERARSGAIGTDHNAFGRSAPAVPPWLTRYVQTKTALKHRIGGDRAIRRSEGRFDDDLNQRFALSSLSRRLVRCVRTDLRLSARRARRRGLCEGLLGSGTSSSRLRSFTR